MAKLKTIQLKKYTLAVTDDERLKSLKARGNYLIILNDYDRYPNTKCISYHRENKVIYQANDKNTTICLKT